MLEDPKYGVGNKTKDRNNIGGVRNTAMAKASGSVTSQKTMGSGTEPHQIAEEELIQ